MSKIGEDCFGLTSRAALHFIKRMKYICIFTGFSLMKDKCRLDVFCLFVKPLHGGWSTHWANIADVLSAVLKFVCLFFCFFQAIARWMTNLLNQHCWCAECSLEVCTALKKKQSTKPQSAILPCIVCIVFQCTMHIAKSQSGWPALARALLAVYNVDDQL